MALSFQQYTGNGVTKDFQITFGYLARAHVSVSINGNPYYDFTFSSATMLRLGGVPAKDSVVELRRTTPRDVPLVDFQDGSTLTETDLDTSALQVFYLAQEAFDMAGGTLSLNSDGSYSALTRRITQVGDPINDMDVATKRWVIADVNSNVAEARAARDAAVGVKTETFTARDSTFVARDNTYTARDTVLAAVAQAETAKTVSTNNKDQTALDKAATATDRQQTSADRIAADASAQAAAASAAKAALFDPSSYYTRVQITQNYYSKTDVDAKVAALNSAIGSKQNALDYAPVNRAGDMMTGPLEIKNDPTLWLHRPNVKRARWVIDANGSLLWQDQGGQNHFWIGGDGSVWTQQLGDLNTRIEQRAGAYADDRKNWSVTASQMAGYVEVLMSNGSVINNGAYVLTMAQRVSGDQYRFGSRQPQLFIQNRGWFAAFPF